MEKSFNNQKLVEKIQTQLSECLYSFIESENNKTKRNAPIKLYHYTDDAGLKGILESGVIRLTQAEYLNDPSELRYGFIIARELFENKLNELNVKFYSQLENLFDHSHIFKRCIPFVASFSGRNFDETVDQWRAYADNGCGFCLEFDTKSLEDAFTQSNSYSGITNHSLAIIYDKNRIRKIITQGLNALIKNIIILDEQIPLNKLLYSRELTLLIKEINLFVKDVFIFYSIFFKHYSYINENEYRFIRIYDWSVSFPPSQFEYRSRRYELIPYVEFNWREVAPHALKRIIVGPNGNQDKAERFARDCLRVYHVGNDKLPFDVEVVRSTIPYRS